MIFFNHRSLCFVISLVLVSTTQGLVLAGGRPPTARQPREEALQKPPEIVSEKIEVKAPEMPVEGPLGKVSINGSEVLVPSNCSESEKDEQRKAEKSAAASKKKKSKKKTKKECVDAFFMDVSEVTRGQYAKCVAANSCHKPHREGCFPGSEEEFWKKETLPMTCVSFYDASAYCRYKKRRLPREIEWVHAGRLQSKQLYPWGDEEPTCERVAGLIRWKKNAKGTDPCPGEAPDPPSDGKTFLIPPIRLAPVCTHPAGNSLLGICDMAGNAGEWVDAEWKKNRYPWEFLIKGSSPLGAESDFIGLDARVWLLSEISPIVGFRCARGIDEHL